MKNIFWIFVVFGWLCTLCVVDGIGCRNRKQKIKDSIELVVVEQDEPEDGEEVVLSMTFSPNEVIVGTRHLSKSYQNVSYYKMISTGGHLKKNKKVHPKPSKSRGQRKVRKFKQVWRGVDVFAHGGTYDAATGELIIGKLARCIYVDLKNPKPVLSMNAAAARVRRRLRRKFIPTKTKRNSKLFVFVDPGDNKAKLVWYLNGVLQVRGKMAVGKPTFSNAVAIVDANMGNILSLNEYRESYLTTGDGGNIKIGKHRYGEGKYKERLLNVEGCAGCPKCVASNKYVAVTNANRNQYYWEPENCFTEQQPYTEQCDPPSPNNDATGQSFSQVHDALYFATTFREMFQDVYNDKTLDKCSKNGQIKICVHYNDSNMAVFKDNGNCEIYFGFGAMGLLDAASASTVAHELGHAFTKVTSNLEYSCQAGGIAESFADICTVAFKAHINGEKIDWDIGGEITINNGSRTAVRYMDDPPRDGHSIDCTRDYAWNSTCWRSVLQDPHRVSGIYNKAFFNLVNTNNWNIMSAFQIFLRANKLYWKSREGFDSGLCALIEATIDIYSAEGNDAAFKRATDVSEAFAKVGVFCGVTGENSQNVAHKPGCPKDWLTLNNFEDEKGAKLTNCFKIINEASTWAEAADHCTSLGAHLAVVDGDEKSAWLGDQVAKETGYWIGGTDVKKEGEWRWAEPFDIAVSWTKWHKGEPTRTTEQNCLAVMNSDGFGWTDNSCSEKKAFICEISCCGLQCRK